MHLCRSMLEHAGKNDAGKNDAWGWEELIERLKEYGKWNFLDFWEKDVNPQLGHDWKDGQISAASAPHLQKSGLKRPAQFTMGPPEWPTKSRRSDGGSMCWVDQ